MEQRSTGNGDSGDGGASPWRGRGGGARGTRELPVGGLGWCWGGRRRAVRGGLACWRRAMAGGSALAGLGERGWVVEDRWEVGKRFRGPA